MKPRRAVAFVLMSLTAVAAFAQSAEYGRVEGGTIEMVAKQSRPFSGSLSVSQSQSSGLFGSGNGLGYGATLGGELLKDRVWFFAAAERIPSISSRYGAAVPGSASTSALDGKLSAQLGDRQNLIAAYSSTQSRGSLDSQLFGSAIPSTFLNLQYTAIVSDNMFFTGSFSQMRRDSSAIQP